MIQGRPGDIFKKIFRMEDCFYWNELICGQDQRGYWNQWGFVKSFYIDKKFIFDVNKKFSFPSCVTHGSI